MATIPQPRSQAELDDMYHKQIMKMMRGAAMIAQAFAEMRHIMRRAERGDGSLTLPADLESKLRRIEIDGPESIARLRRELGFKTEITL